MQVADGSLPSVLQRQKGGCILEIACSQLKKNLDCICGYLRNSLDHTSVAVNRMGVSSISCSGGLVAHTGWSGRVGSV